MSFSVIGDRRTSLPAGWSREKTVNLIGDSEIDGSAGASPGAVLTLVSIVGDAKVRVPAGSRVTIEGFNLVGDRKVRVASGEGPDITVKVYTLFGDLQVSDGTAP